MSSSLAAVPTTLFPSDLKVEAKASAEAVLNFLVKFEQTESAGIPADIQLLYGLVQRRLESKNDTIELYFTAEGKPTLRSGRDKADKIAQAVKWASEDSLNFYLDKRLTHIVAHTTVNSEHLIALTITRHSVVFGGHIVWSLVDQYQ